LGEQVMAYLQKLDEVAYVRFASVYRSFKDLRQFLNELQDLMKREQNSATEERR
ncbi:MAG: transcriptional regulator NrdR, partial [Deltaproteobacteria bacterium]